MIAWELPDEFEPEAYRRALPELAALTDDELVRHYNSRGKALGIPGNRLADRGDFAALIPAQALALEIGPFAAPVLSGPNVRYCDVLGTAQLRSRAIEHDMDPANVPEIHHVMGNGTLDEIPGQFDALLSSHAIEHQPDLVAHLQQVQRRLAPGGRYFVLVPDKRYCFDRNLAPSTIAEVLQAHHERRTSHTLRSVIEHRAYMVHNQPRRHWGDRSPPADDSRGVAAAKVRAALEEYQAAAGGYIDVHAWYFTPDSFRNVMRLLAELELTTLRVERLYRSLRGTVEFWAVLSTQPLPPGPLDVATSAPEVAVEHDASQAAPAAPRRRSGLLARTLRTLFGNG